MGEECWCRAGRPRPAAVILEKVNGPTLKSIADFYVRGSGVDRDSGASFRADQGESALRRIGELELGLRAPSDLLDLGLSQLSLSTNHFGLGSDLIAKEFDVHPGFITH